MKTKEEKEEDSVELEDGESVALLKPVQVLLLPSIFSKTGSIQEKGNSKGITKEKATS